MEEVVIAMNSVHRYGQDSDDLNFTTDGLYSFDGGNAQIVYYESEVTGMPGTRTTLHISPEQVKIDREGQICSSMIFRTDKREQFQYETPYGMATLGVDTRRLAQHFTPEGGELNLEFVLDMEHAVVTQNDLQIKVYKIGDTLNG